MKYEVIIEEVVSDRFVVEAESEEKAIDKTIEMYDSGDIVLAPGNLQHKQLAIVKPKNKKLKWIEF